jgi:hypothetical protein
MWIKAHQRRSSTGSSAMLAAMRRASSRVSRFCARPTTRLVLILQVCKRLPVVIADDEAGAVVLNLPPRRKATVRHNAAIEHIMRPRLGVNRACMMP